MDTKGDARPNYEAMSKEELISIIDDLREALSDCDDAREFCIDAGEILSINPPPWGKE